MIIYYISLISLSLLGYCFCNLNNNIIGKKLYLFLTGCTFTIFITLRYAIGFDYFSYRSIFYKLKECNIFNISVEYPECPKEILFIIMTKFISNITNNYNIFLFIIGIFINIITMIFIYKYSKIPWISIYLYITFHFLAYNMNLIRQSIAVLFVLISYPYLKNKKFIPYLFIILLGAGFHKSIICMIPLYFLLNYIKTLKQMTIIGTIVLVVYSTLDIFIDILEKVFNLSYIQAYKNSYYWRGNSIKYIIFPTIYFLIVLYFRKLLLNNKNSNLILVNSAFYNFLICIFITKHFILERFSIYMFIFSLILIPEIINISKHKKTIIFITILLGLGYFLFGVNEGFHKVYPYVSIFRKL